jgi:hypothetical protein
MKYFNSDKVAEYIIEKTLDIKIKKIFLGNNNVFNYCTYF